MSLSSVIYFGLIITSLKQIINLSHVIFSFYMCMWRCDSNTYLFSCILGLVYVFNTLLNTHVLGFEASQLVSELRFGFSLYLGLLFRITAIYANIYFFLFQNFIYSIISLTSYLFEVSFIFSKLTYFFSLTFISKCIVKTMSLSPYHIFSDWYTSICFAFKLKLRMKFLLRSVYCNDPPHHTWTWFFLKKLLSSFNK